MYDYSYIASILFSPGKYLYACARKNYSTVVIHLKGGIFVNLAP